MRVNGSIKHSRMRQVPQGNYLSMRQDMFAVIKLWQPVNKALFRAMFVA